ncbi:uncharacterized protein DKFZp434B061-like [Homalodisca vitripennis]|uniref:uncharacterized protein DKFZp434B061-like n=1 Tax=Homalodisca vitripennis TaxID=197043 RepID=UPI001EEA4181|nr:uncharacterized protein DKFZp434B061-like [Homalodisca vitripennis]
MDSKRQPYTFGKDAPLPRTPIRRVVGPYPQIIWPIFPYDELLELFGFRSLELRRKVASLMFLYKLVRGLVDDPASLAVLSYRVPSFNSRSNLLFSVPFCRTTARASSPLYRQLEHPQHTCRSTSTAAHLQYFCRTTPPGANPRNIPPAAFLQQHTSHSTPPRAHPRSNPPAAHPPEHTSSITPPAAHLPQHSYRSSPPAVHLQHHSSRNTPPVAFLQNHTSHSIPPPEKPPAALLQQHTPRSTPTAAHPHSTPTAHPRSTPAAYPQQPNSRNCSVAKG